MRLRYSAYARERGVTTHQAWDLGSFCEQGIWHESSHLADGDGEGRMGGEQGDEDGCGGEGER